MWNEVNMWILDTLVLPGAKNYIYAWPWFWNIKGGVSAEHLSNSILITSKKIPHLPAIHILAPISLNKDLVWYEHLKPLSNYDCSYWADVKIIKSQNGQPAHFVTKITHNYLSADYCVRQDLQTGVSYLKTNGSNPVTEYHCHMHMELIVEQALMDVKKWNQAYEKMLLEMRVVIPDIVDKVVWKYDLIGEQHHSLYVAQGGKMNFDPKMQATVKAPLASELLKNPEVYNIDIPLT